MITTVNMFGPIARSGVLSQHLTVVVTIVNTSKSYVTGTAKFHYLSTKIYQFLVCLLYHNLITVYTTAIKSSSLLQNSMGLLLQLTEMG